MDKEQIIEALQNIIDYPKEGHPRRTSDGYPEEMEYDDFAYERMVDSYRAAIRQVINNIKTKED